MTMKYVLCALPILFTMTVSAQTAGSPCSDPHHRDFDFWIGDWEVTDHEGQLQGSNSIQVMHNACALQENWKGLTADDQGTSQNFYNAAKSKWQQVWVSNSGYVLELEGALVDGAMVLQTPANFAAATIDRISWEPNADGTVIQHWQTSSDGGQTWKTKFYGIYRRVSPPNQPRVTGVGGIFFKSNNPAELKHWYEKHLGLKTDQYGTNFEWRLADNPSKRGYTQWSPFDSKTLYFAPSEKAFMFNYRVTEIEILVANLRAAGVEVCDEIETFDYGKFVHIMDPEGNKIELWEPNDIEYDKLVEGRTK